MYAQIHAQRALENSKGKTTWVNSTTLRLSIKHDRPAHIGRPDWYLSVTAESSEEIGSGIAGGEWKEIDRELLLELTPDDLASLFNFAHENGLLTHSVTFAVKGCGDSQSD